MAKGIEVDLNAVNLIASTTLLKGNIQSDTDIRIDGNLEGNLETKGRLIIGSKGKINGDVKCKMAEIEGSMLGNIQVEGQLILKNGSHFTGDITTAQLMVDSGALFNGTCKMGKPVEKA